MTSLSAKTPTDHEQETGLEDCSGNAAKRPQGSRETLPFGKA